MEEEEYLGVVKIFAGSFAPRGWAFCEGQLMSIMQNPSLYSLLGSTYGGDGKISFALPDLQGRMVIGRGRGLGLSDIFLGEEGGEESVRLTLENLPAHNHPVIGTVQLPVNDAQADLDSPVDAYLAQSTTSSFSGTPGTRVAGKMKVNLSTAMTGGFRSVDISSPYLGMNYIICTEGNFPVRN